VFGRAKSKQPAAPATPEPPVRPGAKGRPTPRRREAEQRNRRPVIGAARVSPNATKEERKAARRAQRAAMNAERAKARQALLTGDERHLPARDRGPVRRFARDFVDARWSPGEFFLPSAVVVLLLSLVPGVPLLRIASYLLLYGLFFVLLIDGVFLARKVRRLVAERYGPDAGQGLRWYTVARSLQMRRLRLPKPQVRRGEYPV
jgi:hypothetical protein